MKTHDAQHMVVGRDVQTIARAMHEALCGSWEAAGYDTKVSFEVAAIAAYAELCRQGLDLFAYPEGGWLKVRQ